MTNLIAELAEVVHPRYDAPLAEKFIRTHHAEIEAMARDADRYRWLRTLQGEVLTKKWNGESWEDASYAELDQAIDAAMRDGAREGGE